MESESPEGRLPAQIYNKHFEYEPIWKLCSHPKLLEIVTAICGEDLVLLSTTAFCKYPGAKYVGTHQDSFYIGLSKPVFFTAWVSIDEATKENGPLVVYEGSHRAGNFTHMKQWSDTDNVLDNKQNICPEELEIFGKPIELTHPVGGVSIHEGRIAHGSGPNKSSQRRLGLAIQFTRSNVKTLSEFSYEDEVDDWRKPVVVAGRGMVGEKYFDDNFKFDVKFDEQHYQRWKESQFQYIPLFDEERPLEWMVKRMQTVRSDRDQLRMHAEELEADRADAGDLEAESGDESDGMEKNNNTDKRTVQFSHKE
eukprot:UN33168